MAQVTDNKNTSAEGKALPGSDYLAWKARNTQLAALSLLVDAALPTMPAPTMPTFIPHLTLLSGRSLPDSLRSLQTSGVALSGGRAPACIPGRLAVQWQCTCPVLVCMWQHCPGGELLRHPPPWPRGVVCNPSARGGAAIAGVTIAAAAASVRAKRRGMRDPVVVASGQSVARQCGFTVAPS